MCSVGLLLADQRLAPATLGCVGSAVNSEPPSREARRYGDGGSSQALTCRPAAIPQICWVRRRRSWTRGARIYAVTAAA